MSKELLLVVEVLANEKGIDKDIVYEAVEAAIASATKKIHGEDIEVRVAIDRETGVYETFRRWEVIDDSLCDIEFPLRQVTLAAVEEDGLAAGEYAEELIESIDFGRIGAQAAKQVIFQKIREAERNLVADEYQERIGETIGGVVRRVDKGNIYLDLGGNVEALILRDQTIPREQVRVGERVKGVLTAVQREQRGPQLLMSRVTSELLVGLFALEVPEISENLVEIMGSARDPGVRAKIAVKANDDRIDPIGACVGMRGTRVIAVSNELAGERVDIVLWDSNAAQFVINAMSPAEVVSVYVNEDAHRMDVAVVEANLSQAIGRGGQNVRLVSELCGWDINVMSEEEAENKSQRETNDLVDGFVETLTIDEEVAELLVQEGFTTLEEIAYVPVGELLEIDGFDEDVVNDLRDRAKDFLLMQAIAVEEKLENSEPADDLLAMRGMSKEIALTLAATGVVTQEDLAECSVDELLEVKGLDATTAAELIMTAREPWFIES